MLEEGKASPVGENGKYKEYASLGRKEICELGTFVSLHTRAQSGH
jgi:hypothetical protein